MKKLIVLTAVLMIFVYPIAAQDTVKEDVIHKQMEEDDPGFAIQIAKGDKIGAMLTSVWAIADPVEGEIEPNDVNWIKYDSAKNLFFYCQYTAQYTTKVRFRLVITGPEFYSRTSTSWRDAKYKTNSTYYVYGPKLEFFKTKGFYNVVFYVEHQKPYGGTQCVASATIRVY